MNAAREMIGLALEVLCNVREKTTFLDRSARVVFSSSQYSNLRPEFEIQSTQLEDEKKCMKLDARAQLWTMREEGHSVDIDVSSLIY